MSETLRRRRLGDLKRLLRSRYGHTLADDDAGRDDLELLLDVVSFASNARYRMKNVIETWAPWMNTEESYELVEHVLRKPNYLRKIKADQLGRRLSLTDQERQALGIRTIRPSDLSPEEFQEKRAGRRRKKDRARKLRCRRRAGVRSRTVYLGASLSRQKPWLQKGVSKATWYRQRAKMRETNS